MNPELKEWVKENSSVVSKEESFTVHEVKTKLKHEDSENKVRVVTLGPENEREVKTVLLLGETGVGKTTFLNAFLNVVFGVGVDDDVRLRFRDQMDRAKDSTQSQTEYTTAFTIYHQDGMPQPFNYMVIDTPGLGDTEGDQKDRVNEKCLRFYLTNESWIKHLNCVGMVWKASNRRLTEHNQEVLSKTKNLLGFDIKPITDVLLTFSGLEDPAAVEVVEAAGIEYRKVFHFENMPLYTRPTKGREAFHALTWESMTANHSKFLEELNQSQPQELKITARLLLAQMKLEKELVYVSALDESSAQKSDELQSHRAKMRNLEEMVSKVDWDKIEELDTSNEEILLDDGRHCHFCKTCQKVCVPVCTDDHQTATDACKDASDAESCPMEEEDPDLKGIDMLLSGVEEAEIPSELPTFFSDIKTVLVRFGKMILGIIKLGRSEAKTQTLHANEGGQRCQVCGHSVLKHEIRHKVLAKDAEFEQKIELLKKRKYEEVSGQKNSLQSDIESAEATLETIQKLKEEKLKILEEKQKEIEKLQTGQ
ncbi:uncharacterized protein LOC122244392 [Penaeus japonicus]|uniref:uncharacterized protein LOC122244392 n=1 Tax=Penaeus japonicus TaxID=27405 RepID=UPI001C714069|nr:uncharacterized protein LOC122244392 [Penaeus japonicus]